MILMKHLSGVLCVWDHFNKNLLSSKKAHEKSVRCVAFSPTGCHYVSASLDGLFLYLLHAWSEVILLD